MKRKGVINKNCLKLQPSHTAAPPLCLLCIHAFQTLSFPTMTSHHHVQQAHLTLEVFQTKGWVCCLSWGLCATACLFWAEKTQPITSSKISEKRSQEWLHLFQPRFGLPLDELLCPSPREKVELSPLRRCWIYPGSKPEPIFYTTPDPPKLLLFHQEK